jgi:PIN domain nuclease of toxin-antitoxin system
MRALIDTHTFLWLTGDTSRLSAPSVGFMDDNSTE